MGRKSRRSSSASRRKSKRAVVVSIAALAVLAVGGTAAFAISDLGAAPGSAASTAVVPEAEVSWPQPPETEPDPRVREQALAERDAVVEQAALSAQSHTSQAEREAEPEPDSRGGPGAAAPVPTGEGGSCEASMYSDPQPTASGELFDPSAMTAAHKTLPFNTTVEVTNIANDRSVTVRINDRGPFVAGRCLDLSAAAFSAIASPSQGVAQVDWRVVE